jgi:gluconate kinase
MHRHVHDRPVSNSPLTDADRDVLRAAAPRVSFIQLAGDIEVVRRPVASQFAALEPLAGDEPGVTLDRDVDRIVEEYLATADKGVRRT